MAAAAGVLRIPLAGILLGAGMTAEVLEHEMVRPRVVPGTSAIEFRLTPAQREKWVRLQGVKGSVVANGTRVTRRDADISTSTIALSPYLNGGVNRIELLDGQGADAWIEIVPRVFPAAVRTGPRIRVLVENTLENAANVQVVVGAGAPQNAYVPPESQVELEFPRPSADSYPVLVTKFPEALEEGYTVRLWCGKPHESKELRN